jgi:ribonuclease E
MTVIDVNTGKFVGAGGNLEQTVTRNNLEAAEEIVRQLRLRDVGGIIVIDFIDMVLESNRELVLRRLTECLGRDRTKHQVAEVTSLGLVQMTRKRVGEGLLEAFSETCEHCKGRGVIIHTEPVDRPGGGANGAEEERPAGKSRRKRGGRAAAAEVEAPPAIPEEQRKAATAAIAAIHRAAAGEEGEDGSENLDALASGLVAAAMVGRAETVEPETVEPAAAELAAVDPAAPQPEVETPAVGVVDSATLPASPDGADPAAEPTPAPRRRRRAAVRPAGPPTTA